MNDLELAKQGLEALQRLLIRVERVEQVAAALLTDAGEGQIGREDGQPTTPASTTVTAAPVEVPSLAVLPVGEYCPECGGTSVHPKVVNDAICEDGFHA